jgi:phosphoglycolate phosphatase
LSKTNDSIKAVLFDLDGTLLNTLNHIGGSVNKVLAKYGLKTHSMEEYKLKIGKGIESLLESSLPKGVGIDLPLNVMLKELKVNYENNINDNSNVYDGVNSLLDLLNVQSINIGIITNKLENLAKQNVDYFFPKWTLDIKGDGGKFPMKPNPEGLLASADEFKVEPNECIYVGDSGSDMVAAKNAGMRAVGVTWGFRTEEELIKNGADNIVHHPLEIIDLVNKTNKKK